MHSSSAAKHPRADRPHHTHCSSVVAVSHLLQVGNLPGVGPKLKAKLADLHIFLTADLLAYDAARLGRSIGAKSASMLRSLAVGEDTRPW